MAWVSLPALDEFFAKNIDRIKQERTL